MLLLARREGVKGDSWFGRGPVEVVGVLVGVMSGLNEGTGRMI